MMHSGLTVAHWLTLIWYTTLRVFMRYQCMDALPYAHLNPVPTFYALHLSLSLFIKPCLCNGYWLLHIHHALIQTKNWRPYGAATVTVSVILIRRQKWVWVICIGISSCVGVEGFWKVVLYPASGSMEHCWKTCPLCRWPWSRRHIANEDLWRRAKICGVHVMYHPIWAFLETSSIQNSGSESLADTLKILRDHTNICGMYLDQVSEWSDCVLRYLGGDM
jgi:hypothetical protein